MQNNQSALRRNSGAHGGAMEANEPPDYLDENDKDGTHLILAMV
eukprot:COSAG02_NODE_375_length_23579_cov_148.725596_4_plen_44_part_00